MRIAVKRDQTIITADGRVGGNDAGATLVRRFLRIFPGAQVVGEAPCRCRGFDVVPLEFLDPEDTIVINMDVLDSSTVWNTVYLASGGVPPRIMNFVWWPLESAGNPVQSATIALSCGLFPTFANSERTAAEVEALVDDLTVDKISDRAELDWVNLGFRLDHVRKHVLPDPPVVLYPAIYLSPVKRPRLFVEIAERVHQRTPLEVEMRLEETALVSDAAQRLGDRDWIHVEPLLKDRAAYWEALSETTAFLATASEESYGLSYVEAMGAGVIGIFPDEDWAHALLPKGYPFIYADKMTAESMLFAAVTDPIGAKAQLDALVGEPFVDWVSRHHSDAAFSEGIQAAVRRWFGDGFRDDEGPAAADGSSANDAGNGTQP